MLKKTLFLAFPLAGTLLMAQEAEPPPSQEARPPAFPGQIEQVTVDVVVTDEEGVPVRGLGTEDLEVWEDGVKQTLVSFEAVNVPPAPAATPKPRPNVSTNLDEDNTQGRTFVLLFDDLHLTRATAHRAKGAIADFLTNGVREGDRVTLVATAAGLWWSTRMEAGRDELIELVKQLEGRTLADNSRSRMTDYEAMRIHSMRDKEIGKRVERRFEQFDVGYSTGREHPGSFLAMSIHPYVEMRAKETYLEARARNTATFEILERSLEALNATKGRKSLILISEGFIYDPAYVSDFRRVLRATRRANTAVYFVNARGLQGMPVYMTAQFGPPLPQRDFGFAFSDDIGETGGSDALASESGGFTIRDTNDLSSGFERIALANSSYYLVGYNPTNTARDGEFRKIKVKVPGMEDVEIRARKGYYAPSDEEDDATRGEAGTDPVFQEALDSPYEMGAIPLRMTHFVGDEEMLGTAHVRVAIDVDVSALDLEERDGRFVGGVEFLLVAAHRETGEYHRYDQKIEMNFRPDTRDRLEKSWFPIQRKFELPTGGYQAKIVVRDMRSARVGTVVHEFEVPALEGFRISTPILTDTRLGEGEDQGKAVLVARREFEQGGDLFCEFDVFGAKRDGSGMPRVGMGYMVRRADGSVLTTVEPAEIPASSIGMLSTLFRVDLSAAKPGDYELVMAFFDMLSGGFVEVTERFSVVAEGALEQTASSRR